MKIKQTEVILSMVLRYGVLLCAASLSLGMILSWNSVSPEILTSLLSGKVLLPSEHQAVTENQFFTSFGLILLIALPIFRVALTGVLFLFQKDYLFFLFSALVLGALLFGVFFGKVF